MQPFLWQPPIALSQTEQAIVKRIKRAQLFVFLRESRHELFHTAWRTLQGYEVIHMIRKGQVQGANKGDCSSQIAFIAELFGLAA